MSIKSKLMIFISASVLTGACFAIPKPECPDIELIKLEGLTRFEKVLANLFFTYHTSQYGTESSWALVMAPIEAETGILALGKANELLTTMSAPGLALDEGRFFLCQYATGKNDVKVVAVLADILISPAKIGGLFKTA